MEDIVRDIGNYIKPLTPRLHHMGKPPQHLMLWGFLCTIITVAINRSKNLISVTHVKKKYLLSNIDLFTYLFPCQDLSIARAWHGENGGINRGAKNRSGML